MSRSVRPKKAHELEGGGGPPPDLTEFLDDLATDKGGDVSKCKVAELKSVLKRIGLRTSGKKAELVESVEAYLREHDLVGGGKKRKGSKSSRRGEDDDDEMDVDAKDGDGDDDETKAKKKPAKRRKKSASVDASE